MQNKFNVNFIFPLYYYILNDYKYSINDNKINI